MMNSPLGPRPGGARMREHFFGRIFVTFFVTLFVLGPRFGDFRMRVATPLSPQPLTMLLLPAAAAAVVVVVVVAPPLREERLLPGVAVFLAAARARPLPLLVALEAAHRPVGEVLQGGAPRRHLEGRRDGSPGF